MEEVQRKTFLGIELAKDRRRFVYAALDYRFSILALGRGPLAEVVAFASGQKDAVAAISIPPRRKERLLPSKKPHDPYTQLRFENQTTQESVALLPPLPLARQKITLNVRNTLNLVEALENLGYKKFPEDSAERQMMETQAESAFFSLAGHALYPPSSLEGRLQRQMILFEEELNVEDPLRFLEEITRHRLLNGMLPLKMIHSTSELNALVSAMTAGLGCENPHRVLVTGSRREGQLIIPLPKEDRVVRENIPQPD